MPLFFFKLVSICIVVFASIAVVAQPVSLKQLHAVEERLTHMQQRIFDLQDAMDYKDKRKFKSENVFDLLDSFSRSLEDYKLVIHYYRWVVEEPQLKDEVFIQKASYINSQLNNILDPTDTLLVFLETQLLASGDPTPKPILKKNPKKKVIQTKSFNKKSFKKPRKKKRVKKFKRRSKSKKVTRKRFG